MAATGPAESDGSPVRLNGREDRSRNSDEVVYRLRRHTAVITGVRSSIFPGRRAVVPNIPDSVAGFLEPRILTREHAAQKGLLRVQSERPDAVAPCTGLHRDVCGVALSPIAIALVAGPAAGALADRQRATRGPDVRRGTGLRQCRVGHWLQLEFRSSPFVFSGCAHQWSSRFRSTSRTLRSHVENRTVSRVHNEG